MLNQSARKGERSTRDEQDAQAVNGERSRNDGSPGLDQGRRETDEAKKRERERRSRIGELVTGHGVVPRCRLSEDFIEVCVGARILQTSCIVQAHAHATPNETQFRSSDPCHEGQSKTLFRLLEARTHRDCLPVLVHERLAVLE